MSTALRRPGQMGHEDGRCWSTLTKTDVVRLAEQRMRSAVNFGVACLRRASGASPDELLDLRCECGQPGCHVSVRISLRDYHAAPLRRALLVRPEHVDQGQDHLRTVTATWAVIEGSVTNPRQTNGRRR